MKQQLRSKSQKRITSANMANVNLHACLNEANHFSQLLDHHLSREKYQNHIFKTAKQHYQIPLETQNRNSKSTISLRTQKSQMKKKIQGLPTVLTMSSLENGALNPQQFVISVLESKALRIPDLSERLQSGKQQRKETTDHIHQLKKYITEEKNKKAKLSIRIAKLMNEEEKSNYQISRLEELSRRRNIEINEVINDCVTFSNDVSNLKNKNKNLTQKIIDEKRLVAHLSDFVLQTKRNLVRETKQLQQLKQIQTISYKALTNDYMLINQLKEQKALLLNSVDANVIKNA